MTIHNQSLRNVRLPCRLRVPNLRPYHKVLIIPRSPDLKPPTRPSHPPLSPFQTPRSRDSPDHPVRVTPKVNCSVPFRRSLPPTPKWTWNSSSVTQNKPLTCPFLVLSFVSQTPRSLRDRRVVWPRLRLRRRRWSKDTLKPVQRIRETESWQVGSILLLFIKEYTKDPVYS